ncbi:MAG: hypothetical protein KJN62_02825 [Deltaproteobacteria bacterium]|nr:hypothetical protein [Deltaproteobacteria bacterium]
MIVVTGTATCGVCKTKQAVVYCDGCGVLLCEDCQQFEYWGYGCGHGDPKAFCSTCYNDIDINPYGGKVPE